MKKIELKDITSEMFEDARKIIANVISWQTMPPKQDLILPILSEIKALGGKDKSLHAGLDAGLRDGLHAGLDDGLFDGLDDGLNDGLYAGLDDGLFDGLDDGLDAGLYAGLFDGLYAGLYAGLDAGLSAGLYAGLDAGLSAGLYDGLDAGLRAGLSAGLYDGLSAGLDAGLDAGLRAGLYAGLFDGLYDGLSAGLNDGLRKRKIKGQLIYCGVFWGWWLCRYLIAHKWGCELNKDKLSLLCGFAQHAPIVLNINEKIVVAKPTKIKWNITGKTKAPFEFPIYELHADGESAVECAGLKMYYWHNVKMPEYIGSVASKDWKAEWILTEENQEIKRVLLENITTEKVAEVLQLKTLDTFKTAYSEYELVEAQNNPYPSRYRALRMTCPSTDKPYLIRVHPNTKCAETAIVRLNGGVHPTSFILET